MSGVRKRILIIDDHPIVRQGLAAVLNRQSNMQVVGEADDARTGYELVRSAQPDLVILDIAMPGVSGLELVARLAATHPELPVIIVSMLHEDEYAARALAAGARGYIMKGESSDRVVAGVNAVLSGKLFVQGKPSAGAGPAIAEPPHPGMPGVEKLTNIELEVLRLLGEGHSTRSIAQLIHKSVKTVELHRARIRQRLGLASANELIIFAARWAPKQTDVR